MIAIGKYNTLRIERFAPPGLYLEDEEGEEVLLPNRWITDEMKADDELEVFIYKDSEDRIIATTEKPYIFRDEFGYLEVKQVTPIGAFLGWGLDKDLLVPFKEQRAKMREGGRYLVYLYLDVETWRLSASAKIQKYIETEDIELEEGEEVDLLICERTDLGVKVIINNLYHGLLYNNEIFKEVRTGDKTTGYVKTIREDGKIDVALEKQGYKSVEPNAQRILDLLSQNEGFLPLHDKSDPEKIKYQLGMSKKLFKKAIGALYKDKRIVIEEKGIRLV
ncbi:MAG: S1-like domain-containing RNA-binding protein [Cyclobacteriaceae bacterium]